MPRTNRATQNNPETIADAIEQLPPDEQAKAWVWWVTNGSDSD